MGTITKISLIDSDMVFGITHLPEKLNPLNWWQILCDILNSEPCLEAETGRNANDACNPFEYDTLGQKMFRSAGDLCMIKEFAESNKQVLQEIREARAAQNESRKKLNLNIRDTNKIAQLYSPHELRELMAMFQKLDENDDLLIDKIEFHEALVHFNPKTKAAADAAVFDLADKSKMAVIDFEEFLEVVAIIDGYSKSDEKTKSILLNPESSFSAFIKIQREGNILT